MELEVLQKLQERMLESGAQTKTVFGAVIPMFHIVAGRGLDDVHFGAEPATLASRQGHALLCGYIGDRMAECSAQAVLTMVDMMLPVGTEEELETRARLRLSLNEAVSLGICGCREGLVCTLETPLGRWTKVQFYEQDPEGKFQLKETESLAYGRYGRFFGFFSPDPVTQTIQ